MTYLCGSEHFSLILTYWEVAVKPCGDKLPKWTGGCLLFVAKFFGSCTLCLYLLLLDSIGNLRLTETKINHYFSLIYFNLCHNGHIKGVNQLEYWLTAWAGLTICMLNIGSCFVPIFLNNHNCRSLRSKQILVVQSRATWCNFQIQA